MRSAAARRRAGRVVGAALGTVLVGVAGVETSLRRGGDAVVAPEELDGTRVAVVLGAQVHPDGRPSRFLRGRLETARRLHAEGRVAALLVSGDDRVSSHAEPTAMRDWLVAAGVPAGDVTVDPHGYDTYDTCWRARHVYGHRRVVMVSQRYHLPRALLTCRLLGLDAVGVGDESVRGGRVWWQGALRERFALLKLTRDVLTSRRPSTER